MGVFDNFLGTPRPQMGTLSSLATMPITMPSLLSQGGGASTPVAAPSEASQVPSQMGSASYHPSVWQTILGSLGDGLLTATGHQAIYAPIAAQNRQLAFSMAKQANQQQLEGQRQRANAQFAIDNREPGPLQQKINDLRANGATDEQIQSYIAAETNPQAAIQVHNAVTGQDSLVFYPKGGVPGAPAAPPPEATPSGLTFTPRSAGGAAPTAPAPFNPIPARPVR